MTSRLSELVTESERARLDLQMLFGVHVFSRAKVVPDLAISRGEDAHRAARLQGDRSIEFLAAGGVAMPCSSSATSTAAERWLGLAASRGLGGPSRERGPSSSRPGAAWSRAARVTPRACASTSSAPSRWRPTEDRASARCEALARLALEAARTGRGSPRAATPHPTGLVELVERSAAQAKELLPLLPGHAPWGAQADAALATVALARGDLGAAATAGGAALEALQAGLHEDASLEIVIPAARACFAGGPPEMQAFVRSTSSRRSRGSPRARLTRRSASGGSPGPSDASSSSWPGRWTLPAFTQAPDPARQSRREQPSLDETERRLLQLLTEGRTNAEIAAEIDLTEEDVAERLTRLFARLGTSSRAEATSLAFRGLATVGSG